MGVELNDMEGAKSLTHSKNRKRVKRDHQGAPKELVLMKRK